jgi:hypothetical protein
MVQGLEQISETVAMTSQLAHASCLTTASTTGARR